jgi:predicted RNA-binding protein YlqC (UPF0109 family)
MSEHLDSAKDYLRSIVSPIVSYPQEVGVEQSTDERGVLLVLSVHPTDMGKVIGKEGETARSLRRILRQYGMVSNTRLSMRIQEPEGSRRHHAAQEDLDVE